MAYQTQKKKVRAVLEYPDRPTEYVEFSSMGEAARAFGVDRKTVHNYCKKRHRQKRVRFEWVL